MPSIASTSSERLRSTAPTTTVAASVAVGVAEGPVALEAVVRQEVVLEVFRLHMIRKSRSSSMARERLLRNYEYNEIN